VFRGSSYLGNNNKKINERDQNPKENESEASKHDF